MAGTQPPQWLVPLDGGEFKEDICLANPRRRQLADAVLFPPTRVVFGAVGDNWIRATSLDGCCVAVLGSGGGSCAATDRGGVDVSRIRVGGILVGGGLVAGVPVFAYLPGSRKSSALAPAPPSPGSLSQVEILNREGRRAALSLAGG